MAHLRQRLQQLAPWCISEIARHSGAQPQTHAPFASLPAALLETRRGFRGSGPLLDFYSVLGVTPKSTDNEIKKAFYKLAKQYHPDTNQDDPTAAKKFQEVQRAYDTLRDSQKRKAYDRMGHEAYENMEAAGGSPGGQGGPFAGSGPFSGSGAQGDAESIIFEFFGGGRRGQGFQGASMFEHMFGGGLGGQRMRMRPTFQTAMMISFEDAVKGTTQTVDLSSLGIPGLGKKKTVELDIPAGVDSGYQLRLEGVLPAGPQGRPEGDLMVQIEVGPSPIFRRENFDLYVDVSVDMVDACLGTSVDVPTVDGTAEVQVKPGTQPGDKLRMRGYGVAKDIVGQKGRRGDQFVRVVVTVPRRLSAAQRQLLEEFRSGKTSSSSEKTGKGWFS
ncbi:hypothetical protein D9Q98_010397 [Chlorella vulgaris]|uniref:J domain-containing protein n=1 Tax=Chlorella vulgaris TaxID=3077 RepID=A0A9D4TRU3_CHLVU|nr:hypothetical protein D9Q98_010397 [Chlorella vulgaris]